jgi:hypothetical protein
VARFLKTASYVGVKCLKALACLGAWIAFTLACGAFGAWWPVRDVDEPWAGDGIGIVMYGALGLMFGAVVGTIALMLFLSRPPRTSAKKSDQTQTPFQYEEPPSSD